MKGLGILLEALAKLRAEHPHAHLVVIGRLKDDSAVPHLISDLGLDFIAYFSQDPRFVELLTHYRPAGETSRHDVLVRVD